jgi:hypothetical protein
MEKKIIHSGAPFALAGLAVLLMAALFGLGGFFSYVLAALAGAAAFAVGAKLFPDREVLVETAPKSGSPEVDALITEARAQLENIRLANDAIAEEELSAQIDDIESTCRLILARLEEQPRMLSALRTFLRYYLPATLKLLSARAKIEGEVQSGGAVQIAQRIREAMSAVQAAFHKQLDALNEYRFINLESEMDVLSDMLKSDGLAPKEEIDPEIGVNLPQDGQEDPFAGLFAGEGK